MPHKWILISLAAMIANLARVVIVKKMTDGIDSRLLLFTARIVTVIVLLPLLLKSETGFPHDLKFWMVTLFTSVITAASSIMFTDAVKHGKLSVIMPMQAAVPVFMLVTSAIVLKELPDIVPIMFMLLSMVALAYTLYSTGSETETDRSERSMYWTMFSLMAAIMFGISTVADQLAIERVVDGALAYTVCWNILSTVILGAESARAGALKNIQFRKNFVTLAVYSIATLSAFYLQQLALQFSLGIKGSVVINKAIIMTHMPLVIIVGLIFFKEKITYKIIIGGVLALLFSIGLLISI